MGGWNIVLTLSLLVVICTVGIVVKYLRIPYTVALVIAGAGLGFTHLLPETPLLTPDLITHLFLPALIFEGAYNIDARHLRENKWQIGILAVPGVILTAVLIALLLTWSIGLAFPLALLFGALVSATDPVSVLALFRTLGVPPRLATIVEGESIANDGTGFVLFQLVLALIISGNFDFPGTVVRFVVVILGGGLFGLVVGYSLTYLLRQVDDHLIETVLMAIAAYGTYLVAERLGVSGVIAVAAVGVLIGNYGQKTAMSPTTRLIAGATWEFFAFVANSFIFLLIGVEAIPSILSLDMTVVCLVIVAVLVVRAIVVYPLVWLTGWLEGHPVPRPWRHIIVWSGLRGSLSLAMALSLPLVLGNGESFPGRKLLLSLTYVVVGFTILVQSLSMGRLLGWLGITQRHDAEIVYEKLQGRLRAIRSARQEISKMFEEGEIGEVARQKIIAEYNEQEAFLQGEREQLHLAHAFIAESQLKLGRHRALVVERAALRELHKQGLLSNEGWSELVAEVDARMMGEPTETAFEDEEDHQ